MTVVAAISINDRLLLGHSDGSELGGTPVVGGFTPWIRFSNWALGVTGESSVQRLLESELINDDAELATADAVISKIVQILEDNQIGSKPDGEYVTTYGIYSILVNVIDRRVWDVSGCLTLTQIPEGKIWSQGSGADYVIGGHYVLARTQALLADEEMMRFCIEAAVANDIHCIGVPVVTIY